MAAATYDISDGSTTQLPSQGVGQIVVVEKVVDFAVHNVGSAETITVINIPAGTKVNDVAVYVNTAEGSDTIDVGDADDDDQYIAAGSLAVASTWLWCDGSTGASYLTPATVPTFYPTANDIRITANAALASGKVTVRVSMTKFLA